MIWRALKPLTLIATVACLLGCVAKEPPKTEEDEKDEKKEESLSQIQPGYVKTVKKLGVRRPDKKPTTITESNEDIEDLAQLLEMDLAEDSVSFGGFQVVDHSKVSEVLRELKKTVAGTSAQSDEERYRKAAKTCGLTAYVDLDIMESDLGQVQKGGGCLFPAGSKKIYCQMAGRAYLVDVETGAIVGVKKFQYRHEGKISSEELRNKVIQTLAQEICDWIRESP